MATVVGVRFKTVGKVYYFDPAGKDYPLGSRVIVETSRGIECGEVAMKNREVPDDSVVKPLKTVIRAATAEDLQRLEDNRRKEQSAAEDLPRKDSEARPGDEAGECGVQL